MIALFMLGVVVSMAVTIGGLVAFTRVMRWREDRHAAAKAEIRANLIRSQLTVQFKCKICAEPVDLIRGSYRGLNTYHGVVHWRCWVDQEPARRHVAEDAPTYQRDRRGGALVAPPTLEDRRWLAMVAGLTDEEIAWVRHHQQLARRTT